MKKPQKMRGRYSLRFAIAIAVEILDRRERLQRRARAARHRPKTKKMRNPVKTSNYWGVSLRTSFSRSAAGMRNNKKQPWHTHVNLPNGKQINKQFATEREAAIYADRINLEHKLGKPLNILKPKV